MNFIPGSAKQAQEVIFSSKLKKGLSSIMPVLLGHRPKNTCELYLTIS